MLKGAIRSRQLAAARNRMMADVPEADVVLVNPTHVAVALRYDPAKGTPRVVAKGAGVVATRIRELAEESRVSMVEDIPLARALHASCEVGQEIPPELYQAVAQVLAFVLSLQAAGAPAGRHRTPRDRRAAARRAASGPVDGVAGRGRRGTLRSGRPRADKLGCQDGGCSSTHHGWCLAPQVLPAAPKRWPPWPTPSGPTTRCPTRPPKRRDGADRRPRRRRRRSWSCSSCRCRRSCSTC